VVIKQNSAQLTAVITPRGRGYNASLDPEASFTFQCDVTGTNYNIVWLVHVDGSSSLKQEIILLETKELMKAAPSLWMRLLTQEESVYFKKRF
jgi:hypothetical protein